MQHLNRCFGKTFASKNDLSQVFQLCVRGRWYILLIKWDQFIIIENSDRDTYPQRELIHNIPSL